MRNVFLTLLLTAVALAVPRAGIAETAPVTPGPGPQELMERVSQELLRDLDANRAELRKDPSGLRALIDRHLLPYFDTDYSARLVLGKHWRAATPAQRQRFIDAFYGTLMADYGNAIVEFTADRLTILPFRGDPAADSATVRTEVKRDDSTVVPVNYSMRRTPEGWKVWDVTIEGISYVRNFRNDFGAEVDQNGLDALIKRLETQNAARQQGIKPAPSSAPSAKTG